MAVNAYRESDNGEMPLDLKLDLLVDAELPEEERRALLTALNEGDLGGAWKELALRFLQRQVEQESVRELMAGGTIGPAEVPENYRFSGRFPKGFKSPLVMSTAAGVLIAVTSALITLYVVTTGGTANGQTATFHVPGQAIGQPEGISVNVPVVRSNSTEVTANFFATNMNDGPTVAKRSVVIQGDGNGNAVVIPVNTMVMRIY